MIRPFYLIPQATRTLAHYFGQTFGKKINKPSHNLPSSLFMSRKTHGQNRIFDILDITCKDEWEQEVKSPNMLTHIA